MEKQIMLVSVIVVLILVAGIVFLVWENLDSDFDGEDSDKLGGSGLPSEGGGGEDISSGSGTGVNDSLYQYFSQNLRAGAVDKVGQPIEGFTPQMFMMAYPVLKAEDFEGVEAQSGIYRVVRGEVIFDGVTEHTASEAISVKGEKTLLDNLSTRFQIPVESKQQVDLILELISGETGIV